MKIIVAAVGKLKAGPERELADRFLTRAEVVGRGLGLAFQFREFPESRAARPETRKDQETAALLASLPDGARIVALDERGGTIDSLAFAAILAKWRDGGTLDLAFLIG